VTGRGKPYPLTAGTLRKPLLICGILSAPLYVATVELAAVRWPGYSPSSQTVSELIGIGAPTRPLVLPLFVVYSLLVYAFGAGVWLSAGAERALRIAAAGIIGKEVLGLIVTLFAPIHLRGVGGTLTDTMHGLLTLVGVVFMVLGVGFAAKAFGTRFRLYSIATIVVVIGFGIRTGLDQPRLAPNLPTPGMGIHERICIYAYLLWVVVLADALLHGSTGRPSGGRTAGHTPPGR
jgi:hypothetical protein